MRPSLLLRRRSQGGSFGAPNTSRISQHFTLSVTNRPPLLARSANGVEESLTRALDPDRLFTLIRHHHPRINQGIHHKQAGQLFHARSLSAEWSEGRCCRLSRLPVPYLSAVPSESRLALFAIEQLSN